MSKRPRKGNTKIFEVARRLADKVAERDKGERDMTSASADAFAEKVPAYFAKAAKGQHEGGKATAKKVKERNAVRNAEIRKEYEHLQTYKNKSDTLEILKLEFHLHRDTITRIIKKAQ